MHVRQLSASQQASLPASSSLSAYGHEVAFDGAYVYYVRDKRIKFHTRVTHSQANKRTRSYGYNEPRQIYRSIYMDGHLLSISDRQVQALHLASTRTVGSFNVTTPQCGRGPGAQLMIH